MPRNLHPRQILTKRLNETTRAETTIEPRPSPNTAIINVAIADIIGSLFFSRNTEIAKAIYNTVKYEGKPFVLDPGMMSPSGSDTSQRSTRQKTIPITTAQNTISKHVLTFFKGREPNFLAA